MLKYGDKGQKVVQLQQALMLEGFPLPRFGADGQLGMETMEAFIEWKFKEDPDGIDPRTFRIDDISLRLLAQIAQLSNVFCLDVREDAWPGAEKGQRKVEAIDTICLHQMAVKDSDYQGWERWRKLAIHWVITCGDNAKAYLLHDLTTKVYHAHGFNSRSVGIEIEGYFSGKGTDASGRYFWQPAGTSGRLPMTPTQAQLEAAKEAIRSSCKHIAALGGQIKYIGAHRQSFGVKESDPGELLWKGVALPMMEELNLTQAPTLKAGKPIPEIWDPRNVGVPY